MKLLGSIKRGKLYDQLSHCHFIKKVFASWSQVLSSLADGYQYFGWRLHLVGNWWRHHIPADRNPTTHCYGSLKSHTWESVFCDDHFVCDLRMGTTEVPVEGNLLLTATAAITTTTSTTTTAATTTTTTTPPTTTGSTAQFGPLPLISVS